MSIQFELYHKLLKEYTEIKKNNSPITIKNILSKNNLRDQIIDNTEVNHKNRFSDESDLDLTEFFEDNKKEIIEDLVVIEKDDNQINISELKIINSPQPHNNISKINSFNTLNIIKPPPLLTHNIYSKKLVGGSNLEFTISIKKINDLLFDKKSSLLRYIMEYYFNNYSQKINNTIIPKILSNNDLLLIIASSIYVFFIDKKYTNLDEVINPEFVNSIPEHFKFNFLDLIKKELKNNINNFSTEQIQKLIYSYYSNSNDSNIDIPKDDYNIIIYNSNQTGGKKINNIDEKIQYKIDQLSINLKNKQKGGESYITSIIYDINKYIHRLDKINRYHMQKGGGLVQDIKNEKTKKDDELERIKTDAIKVKVHNEKMIDKANIWAVELINQGVAIKEIEDNEYGIARFVLTPFKEEDKQNPEIIAVLAFINDTASILRFKNDYQKNEFANMISPPMHLGNVRPSYITDKLTKYYQKKYEELQKLKDPNSQYEDLKKENDMFIFDKIKLFLGFRGGDPTRDMILDSDRLSNNIYNTNFLEHCFTSKQYVKFLDKMKSYLQNNGKTLELNELKGLREEIDQVKKIEEHLLEINKLLVNYKIITDEFPENIKKDITFQHMKNILKSNNVLIDEYGNVNLKTLGVIKKIEQYIDLKDDLDSKINKEINILYQQNGGSTQHFNKKYMVNNDYEFFTTDKFQKVLDELKKEK